MCPFTRGSSLEKQLEKQYAAMLERYALPRDEAQRIATELLVAAKTQASSDPDLPSDFAERLIQREHTDDSIEHMLAPKRAEGVKDSDIRWWWGLDKLERRLLILYDDWFRLTAFKRYREDGMSEEQAASQLRKAFPIFGNPEDVSTVDAEDRALPFELKDRINRWACLMQPAEIQSELRSASSMNALLRRKIRAGEL